MIGTFSFQSAKQERQHNVHQGRCRAYMFVMRVAEELEVWPEGTERQRCWVSRRHLSLRTATAGTGALGSSSCYCDTAALQQHLQVLKSSGDNQHLLLCAVRHHQLVRSS